MSNYYDDTRDYLCFDDVDGSTTFYSRFQFYCALFFLAGLGWILGIFLSLPLFIIYNLIFK